MMEVKQRLSDFMENARGNATVVGGRVVVSTVRLPETYEYRWESKAFPVKDGYIYFGHVDCCRYDDAEEARVGHDAMVAKWTAKFAATADLTLCWGPEGGPALW